jgi:hypothetical protein
VENFDMSDEWFWGVIDEARGSSQRSASPERLAEILRKLSDVEILEFGDRFYQRVCDLNSWRLWAAGFLIAGGMSDDSFHYFRSWIVGKGKEVFEVAVKEPDDLGPFVDDREPENELLEYVTLNLAEQRGIEEDPRDRSGRRADAEPAGQPFNEDSVGSGLPKLASQFG